MAIPWGLVALVVGAAYGYFNKGKQDKSEIFKTGVVWGLIIAAVLAILSGLTGTSAMGVGSGFVSMVLGFVITLALFVGGIFLGDVLERSTS